MLALLDVLSLSFVFYLVCVLVYLGGFRFGFCGLYCYLLTCRFILMLVGIAIDCILLFMFDLFCFWVWVGFAWVWFGVCCLLFWVLFGWVLVGCWFVLTGFPLFVVCNFFYLLVIIFGVLFVFCLDCWDVEVGVYGIAVSSCLLALLADLFVIVVS